MIFKCLFVVLILALVVSAEYIDCTYVAKDGSYYNLNPLVEYVFFHILPALISHLSMQKTRHRNRSIDYAREHFYCRVQRCFSLPW